MRSWKLLQSAVLIGLLAAPPLWAQQAGPRALVIEAENLTAEAAEAAEREGDSKALYPGDVVLYRLTFTNVTEVPVRNVEFEDPLPRGLRYLADSAGADREDVEIAYSIDGGQSYSAVPMIEVVVDGERVQRRAPPEMYTHIRWMVSDWVQPGAQVTAEFKAQLPTPR